ncbi:MAG: type III-B CRISPR module-associated protein Cmr5 [Candidatus Aminicenantes bacterium]|nr:type III-B CRISPR module-associated protein Cmr5 [Candidatus Aminicenantes bacterium]
MSENDKITVKGIDRQRAVLAYDCVTEVDEQSNGKKKKEYKSYIKKMPSLIKTNGLGQTLAFYLSKAARKDNAYTFVFDHIEKYLKEMKLLGQDDKEMIKFIIEQNSADYRYITTEILAFLNWVKRFADGRIEGEDQE